MVGALEELKMTDADKRRFEVASGYADLSMWEECWQAIEELEEGRLEPEVMMLRLRVCVALEWWEMGENVAGFLASSERGKAKRSAAEYFHRRAQLMCRSGKIEAARREVARAVAAWRDVRLEILEDDSLALIW